jgi:hypothetical protein
MDNLAGHHFIYTIYVINTIDILDNLDIIYAIHTIDTLEALNSPYTIFHSCFTSLYLLIKLDTS